MKGHKEMRYYSWLYFICNFSWFIYSFHSRCFGF